MLNELLALISGRVSWVEAGPYLLGLILALITGIAFHEFGHAFVAYQLGDPMPKRMGRVTLNPAAHLDPMGTIMFVLAGFGWGRPVLTNPALYRINPRVGQALVALAGPVANILLAGFASLFLRVLILALGGSRVVATSFALETLLQYIYFNLLLAFFNLIPIPPLDGFSILLGVLPPDLAYSLERIRQYGFLLLFLLVIAGGGILGQILNPAINTVFRLMTGL